jgi:hypothetical protein
MSDGKKKDWSSRNMGSGTFIISKPKRRKTKLRSQRVHNVRRAR